MKICWKITFKLGARFSQVVFTLTCSFLLKLLCTCILSDLDISGFISFLPLHFPLCIYPVTSTILFLLLLSYFCLPEVFTTNLVVRCIQIYNLSGELNLFSIPDYCVYCSLSLVCILTNINVDMPNILILLDFVWHTFFFS